MALFNRRKDHTISDLEDYYANRNNRTGMAWLMAFLSLLVTIGVIAALFFGGRWAYRALTDDNTTVITTTKSSGSESEAQTTTDTATEATVPVGSTDSTSPEVEAEGVVSEEAASTTTPSTSRQVASATTSTDEAGKGDSDLPNTGAGEILLIAPFIAGILGYTVSRRRQIR
ncbi:hypothetical protein KC959_00055 [Candidatus Saccharibacteria bacterium]|nr:hypothetical protein [Candidatus Saccharibacteria bacterium]